MTRMIERWFPCAEVSLNSESGWGSGNTERNLFTWFAARPSAQAKAAVITSLVGWPEDEAEQRRLQDLVRDAMSGRYAKWSELREEIFKSNPAGADILDPFSGRGMIPLEAARLGVEGTGIDYSPVAVLASRLLTEYPFVDWSDEPQLPFAGSSTRLDVGSDRLLQDVEAVLGEIGRRYAASMEEFFPVVDGRQPWGYLWAVTLPCQECGRRFPLIGSYELRKPGFRRGVRGSSRTYDEGQSYYIHADPSTGCFQAIVHQGLPKITPTLTNALRVDGKKVKGKSAVCPFCEHVHALAVHQRLARERQGCDAVLLAADLDPQLGKSFRELTPLEFAAATSCEMTLGQEEPFSPVMPAVPDEAIPENDGPTIRPQLYGARTYGDLMCDRQTLGFVRLCRSIDDIGRELVGESGISADYSRALVGYAGATLVRLLRYSTRGAWLRARDKGTVEVAGIFVNESTISFSYDFFEAGSKEGPGTWQSMAEGTVTTLRGLLKDLRGTPTTVARGTATSLPFSDGSKAAVVTDPPYDAMVYYSDSSDLFYTWLKRALFSAFPEFGFTGDPLGLQEKTEEIIVKEHGIAPGEHRTREHYDRLIARAFAEARRVVRADGVVSIVFGHGEPEVWHRLLKAITQGGLVLTGSWPAKTESGGQQGKANIVTTLTMSCRPAPPNRKPGRANLVEAEVRREVKDRVPAWEAAGLAPTDQMMASAGPAMEVVGRYSSVLDNLGEPVEPDRYLLVARRAVEEAGAIEIDHLPLETFDPRTRFGLSWARLYGRDVAPKSEARWQALASDLEMDELLGILSDEGKGYRLSFAAERKMPVSDSSEVIDVIFALASAWEEGLDAVGTVLRTSHRSVEDPYLWGAMSFLSTRLPEADPDAMAWTGLVRNRRGVGTAVREATTAQGQAAKDAEARRNQGTLFGNADEETIG